MALKVKLQNRGNIDFGENPNSPLDGVPEYFQDVFSLQDASQVCLDYIKKYELGGGNWTGGYVYQDNEQIAYISYNGRIWDKGSEYYHQEKHYDTELMKIAIFWLEMGFLPQNDPNFNHKVDMTKIPYDLTLKLKQIRQESISKAELVFNHKYDPSNFEDKRNHIVEKYAKLLEEKYKAELYEQLLFYYYDALNIQ